MTIALATTWNPRGELPRFNRLLPQLKQVYAFIIISFPPVADSDVIQVFQTGHLASRSDLVVALNRDWSHGRYVALQKALEIPADYIQYADMDRLLRWVETRPREWLETVAKLEQFDCLVIGRTDAAYRSHPQALIQTEMISNRVVSYLLGRSMDVSAGSKAFSRPAAEFLVAHTEPGHALGTDGEWPILLHRAGFTVGYVEVDGLDWESADRHRQGPAGLSAQRLAAEAYDADPSHWAWRAQVALEIIQCALDSAHRTLPETSSHSLER